MPPELHARPSSSLEAASTARETSARARSVCIYSPPSPSQPFRHTPHIAPIYRKAVDRGYQKLDQQKFLQDLQTARVRREATSCIGQEVLDDAFDHKYHMASNLKLEDPGYKSYDKLRAEFVPAARQHDSTLTRQSHSTATDADRSPPVPIPRSRSRRVRDEILHICVLVRGER